MRRCLANKQTREGDMNKRLLGFIIVIFMVIIMVNVGLSQEMGIITGGKKGTYYQFGLNLAQLAKPSGIKLSVYNSKGSVENIYAVYRRPRTQLGIVQADVLAFVAKVQTDPVLKRIAKKIKMVFPLYNEEIHLLGRREITDFDDLADRRVAIGKEGSGTYLTARLLFEVADVAPREMVAIGTDDALAQLKEGKIDAMFYVAGLPVKLFRESVKLEDELALIPIMNKSILEFYPGTDIPANTYTWQNESVSTVAVKAVLVSFNFRRNNCDYVGRLARILHDNLDWLRENGHPKWKFVDLNFPLKGWEQYDCVKKHLKTSQRAEREKSQVINPVLDAIKEMLGE
jgi:TRAP transporter TAXI family solute receptor